MKFKITVTLFSVFAIAVCIYTIINNCIYLTENVIFLNIILTVCIIVNIINLVRLWRCK